MTDPLAAAVTNLVPLTNPPVLIARDDGTIYIIDLEHSHRYALTPEQARTYASVLLALADDLPISTVA
jgi:hypothetical protein